MSEILASGALVVGSFFILLSALGLLRLPDVYSRLHAVTKASTFGMAGTLVASALFFGAQGTSVAGEAAAMWFVMLTNPVGGHMIARSAYLIGIRMTELSVVDQLGRAGESTSRHDVE